MYFISDCSILPVSERSTFVLRVLFWTNPLFNTRSNSKLPFWLTGENVSSWRCEFRSFEAEVGGGSVTEEGGGIWRGAVRPCISRGCDAIGAVCISAMAVVLQQYWSHTSKEKELLLFFTNVGVCAWLTLVLSFECLSTTPSSFLCSHQDRD